jgi:hypothetical protein
MTRNSILGAALIAALGLAGVAGAQLSSAWMVPAAAHTPGVNGTFWYTDLSLHNPHGFTLPVRVFFLESNRDNGSSPVLDLDLHPYETVNLWNVLGPDVFAVSGTGAFLVFADYDRISCPTDQDCAFLASSRTYTPDLLSSLGEFGQGIPGRSIDQGVDWGTYGYVGGVLNDGSAFRCNVGAASWTDAWTTVWVDVQDSDGTILATEEFQIPPFGHVQRRLTTPVTGGSLVFYLVEGPGDSLVFPYASVVNQDTGDPTFLAAEPSTVGVSVFSAGALPKRSPSARPHPQPAARLSRPALPAERPVQRLR